MNTIYNRFYYADPTGKYPHGYFSRNIIGKKYGWKWLEIYSKVSADISDAPAFAANLTGGSTVLLDCEGKDTWSVYIAGNEPLQVLPERVALWDRLVDSMRNANRTINIGAFRQVPLSAEWLFTGPNWESKLYRQQFDSCWHVVEKCDFVAPAIYLQRSMSLQFIQEWIGNYCAAVREYDQDIQITPVFWLTYWSELKELGDRSKIVWTQSLMEKYRLPQRLVRAVLQAFSDNGINSMIGWQEERQPWDEKYMAPVIAWGRK
jgi:hypothetical protein